MTRIPRDPTEQSGKRSMGKKHARAAKAGSAQPSEPIIHGAVPPRDVLMRFIAENPDRASKREIAKAFGLKGETRVELKTLLRSLEEDGLVAKKRKSLVRPGALPPLPCSTSPFATSTAN